MTERDKHHNRPLPQINFKFTKPSYTPAAGFDRPLEDQRRMDIAAPDLIATRPAYSAEPFAQRQIDAACDALPSIKNETPEARAARREDAHTLFADLNPRNAVEAALAAEAVLAHFNSMAMYARAGEPDRPEPEVMRLTSAARSEARSFKATTKDLEKRRAAEAKATGAEAAAQEPEFKPIPRLEVFQPRDRHGQPIPRWRNDLMTPKQKHATYRPHDHDAWAEATIEEDAMIAEQQAMDAAAAPQPSTAERFPSG